MSPVLVSALVSAFVTLAIEWLAKPSLEARKARIIETDARRRLALKTCRELLYRLGMIDAYRTLPTREDPAILAVVNEARDEASKLAKLLHDLIAEIALELPEDARLFAARATGFISAALRTTPGSEDVVADCGEPLGTLAWVLETMPRLSLNSFGRPRAIRAGRAWLAKNDELRARVALRRAASAAPGDDATAN